VPADIDLGQHLRSIGVNPTLVAHLLTAIVGCGLGYLIRGARRDYSKAQYEDQIDKLKAEKDHWCKRADERNTELTKVTIELKRIRDWWEEEQKIHAQTCDKLNALVGERPTAIWKHPTENITVLLAGPPDSSIIGATVRGIPFDLKIEEQAPKSSPA